MTDSELDSRLAELLVRYDVLTPVQMERARAYQAAKQSTLAGALCELHLVPDDVLRPTLEELTGARAVDPSLLTVYPDFVERMNLLISPDVVTALVIFPVQMELNAIHVCMLNPTDGWTVRTLESLSGCRIVPAVIHETALVAAIEKHYGKYIQAPPRYVPEGGRASAESAYRGLLQQPLDGFVQPVVSLINRNRDALLRDPAALEPIIRDPHIIRLVQQILCRAIEGGASDVHLEPTGDVLRVRARIDGAMRVRHTLPQIAAGPIIARVKAMADLPIQPSPVPLDARIGYELVWGRGIDLRFSAVPSITGENIVMRVLDRSRRRWQLSDLGVDEQTRDVIERSVALPNGLVLVTGPTGSGKTSTLYALLDRLNEDDTCILTAEDPVESRITGITQVQCDEAAGLSYAAALRSFLRQDPDVLMVGEVRDAETADIALKAALTGHLVLSTLHTNDAPGAVLRLINMDLEPFIIASALRLVIAQRLIRRLCPDCKAPVAPGSPKFQVLVQGLGAEAQELLSSGRVYEPIGCDKCESSGYRGRTGIFETLSVTEPIEELIISRASAAVIRAQARAEGMRTLRLAGLHKVLAGETSMSEVLEHTMTDTPEPSAGRAAAPR
jgi:type IV pilus assembly protein PilB